MIVELRYASKLETYHGYQKTYYQLQWLDEHGVWHDVKKVSHREAYGIEPEDPECGAV